MTHWLFGGRTDLTNLVLLCDRDHGLVHDLDLAMTLRDGVLVVTAPDGRRVWGSADAAFVGGIASLGTPAPSEDAFVGVHPVDTVVGRRPAIAAPASRRGPAGRTDRVTRPGPTRLRHRRVAPTRPIVLRAGIASDSPFSAG